MSNNEQSGYSPEHNAVSEWCMQLQLFPASYGRWEVETAHLRGKKIFRARFLFEKDGSFYLIEMESFAAPLF